MFSQFLGNTEVSYFDIEVIRNKDVLALQVSVHHLLVVQVVYTLHYLFYHLLLLFQLLKITAGEKKREFLETGVLTDYLVLEVYIPL